MSIEIDFGSVLTNLSRLETELPTAMESCMTEIAEEQTQIVKDTFGSSMLTPNSEVTASIKGGNEPLVESGSMRDSLYQEVEKNGNSISALTKTSDWKVEYHALGYTTAPNSAFPFAYIPSRDPASIRVGEIEKMAVEKVKTAIDNIL